MSYIGVGQDGIMYAGVVGYTHAKIKDAFIALQLLIPTDGLMHTWDEPTLAWKEI